MFNNCATPFLSVVVTSFCRPDYLLRCIESIHKYADMPFELIVNDDGSDRLTKDILYSLQDKISSTVFNNGINIGINEAINRGVSVAKSDYIVFLCDDCWLERPCFKDVYNVLSRPYVGWVCPGDNRFLNIVSDTYSLEFPKDIPLTTVNNTKFSLTNNLLGGYTLGFRKSVWKEIGGLDFRASSGRSDNIFLCKILAAGYWKATLDGPCKIELANNKPGYVVSVPLMKGDNNLPKLFGTLDQNFLKLDADRVKFNQEWENNQIYIPGGFANLQYWFEYFFDIFNTKFNSIFEMKDISHDVRRINWEVAKKHKQNIWKDQIEKDFINGI